MSDHLDERKRVQITQGMANAMGGRGPARVCKNCSLKVPPYPGRYPESCPACGGKLGKPAKAYENVNDVVVCVSRVPRIQAVIDASREMGERFDAACSIMRSAPYSVVEKEIPGGVHGLAMFLEGPHGGVHYRIEGAQDPVLIFELDDSNERVRLYATSHPESLIGFDPRAEMIAEALVAADERLDSDDPEWGIYEASATATRVIVPPGNLGIPRIEMPQITASDLPDFLSWLKKQGIHWLSSAIPAADLKATQREINSAKVAKLIDKADGDPRTLAKTKKPVLTSIDRYILDGHHRWAALYNVDPMTLMPCIVLQLPVRLLLPLMQKYPRVFHKGIDEVACGGGMAAGAAGATGGSTGGPGQYGRKSINSPRKTGDGANRAVGRTRFEIGANRKLDPSMDKVRDLQNARNAKRGLAKRIKAAKDWHTKSAQGAEYHRSLGRYNTGNHRGQPLGPGTTNQTGQMIVTPARAESEEYMGESLNELGPGGVGILPSVGGANPEQKTIDDVFDACLRKLITIESQDILQDVEFTDDGAIYFYFDPSIDDQEMFEVLTVLRSANPNINIVGSPDGRVPGETEPAQWWVLYLPPMQQTTVYAPEPGVPDTTPPDEERGVTEPETPGQKQQMVVTGKTTIDQMAADLDLDAALQAVGESQENTDGFAMGESSETDRVIRNAERVLRDARRGN